MTPSTLFAISAPAQAVPSAAPAAPGGGADAGRFASDLARERAQASSDRDDAARTARSERRSEDARAAAARQDSARDNQRLAENRAQARSAEGRNTVESRRAEPTTRPASQSAAPRTDAAAGRQAVASEGSDPTPTAGDAAPKQTGDDGTPADVASLLNRLLTATPEPETALPGQGGDASEPASGVQGGMAAAKLDAAAPNGRPGEAGGPASHASSRALASTPGGPADNAALGTTTQAAPLVNEPTGPAGAEGTLPLPLPALAGPASAGSSSAAPPAAAEARLPSGPGHPDFAPQLGAQLTLFVREGVQQARLQLHPAEMGPITVHIRVDGGAAQVHMAAEHAATRQALEQAMPTLAGSLREAGLTLTGGGVFEQPRDPRGDIGNGNDGSGSRAGSQRGDTGAEPGQREVASALPAPLRGARRGVVDLVA
jgi:flagellar hook-length control protein FliK